MKKGHKVSYEWLAEMVLTEGTDDFCVGDIIEVNRFNDAVELNQFLNLNTAYDGCRYEIGLVKDILDEDGSVVERSWAYAADGEIPTHFEDSFHNNREPVPELLRKQFVMAWGRSADVIPASNGT